MARIAGVDLPREKRVEIALTYIYGIGRNIADEIIEATGVNPDTRVKDLTEEDIGHLVGGYRVQSAAEGVELDEIQILRCLYIVSRRIQTGVVHPLIHNI